MGGGSRACAHANVSVGDCKNVWGDAPGHAHMYVCVCVCTLVHACVRVRAVRVKDDESDKRMITGRQRYKHTLLVDLTGECVRMCACVCAPVSNQCVCTVVAGICRSVIK